MSQHCGYIVKIKELRPHSNADRLQVATFFGEDTCIDLNHQLGEQGIYFPCELQLSEAFCEANNLVRKKDENGNNIGGYLDSTKRNVTAINLRGERSTGMYLPIECLAFTGAELNSFSVGDPIDVVNGIEICRKYVPIRRSRNQSTHTGNKTRKKKANIAPLFQPHVDTEQLAYNLEAFKPGDLIEITEKLHGTSARTARLPVFKKFKRSLLDKLLHRDGKPVYEDGYVSGTRRTVLENFEGGFYGSNAFREPHSKMFEGKLNPGETVYGEIVGFTNTGAPIMPPAANKALNDKDFIKRYGDTTIFSYGCSPDGKKKMYGKDDISDFMIEEEIPQSKFYAYRMTYTTPEGDVIEYQPSYMRYRCEQMNVECVPILWKGYIPQNVDAGEWIKAKAEEYYEGSSLLDASHLREGVVIRKVDSPKFSAFKHKSFAFKVLSGIAVDNAMNADVPQDLLEEM